MPVTGRTGRAFRIVRRDAVELWNGPVGRTTLLALSTGIILFLAVIAFVVLAGNSPSSRWDYVRSVSLDKWLLFLGGCVGATVALVFQITQASVQQGQSELERTRDASKQMLDWSPLIDDPVRGAAAWLAMEELAKGSPFFAQGVARAAIHTIHSHLYQNPMAMRKDDGSAETPAESRTSPSRQGKGGARLADKAHLSVASPLNGDGESAAAPTADAVSASAVVDGASHGTFTGDGESAVAAPVDRAMARVAHAAEAWECLRNLLSASGGPSIVAKIGEAEFDSEGLARQSAQAGLMAVREFPGPLDMVLGNGRHLDLTHLSLTGEGVKFLRIRSEGGTYIPPALVPRDTEWQSEVSLLGLGIGQAQVWPELRIAGQLTLYIHENRGDLRIKTLTIEEYGKLRIILGSGSRLIIDRVENSGYVHVDTGYALDAAEEGERRQSRNVLFQAYGDALSGGTWNVNVNLRDSRFELGVNSKGGAVPRLLTSVVLESSLFTLNLTDCLPLNLSELNLFGGSVVTIRVNGGGDSDDDQVLILDRVGAECSIGDVPTLRLVNESSRPVIIDAGSVKARDLAVEVAASSPGLIRAKFDFEVRAKSSFSRCWMRGVKWNGFEFVSDPVIGCAVFFDTISRPDNSFPCTITYDRFWNLDASQKTGPLVALMPGSGIGVRNRLLMIRKGGRVHALCSPDRRWAL